VCGDHSGKLWTYCLHNLLTGSHRQHGELVPPTEVVSHPNTPRSLAFVEFVLLMWFSWGFGGLFQVLEWPAPLTKASPRPVEPPSINSVAAGPGLSYLVALSDKNMVVVWKRQDSP